MKKFLVSTWIVLVSCVLANTVNAQTSQMPNVNGFTPWVIKLLPNDTRVSVNWNDWSFTEVKVPVENLNEIVQIDDIVGNSWTMGDFEIDKNWLSKEMKETADIVQQNEDLEKLLRFDTTILQCDKVQYVLNNNSNNFFRDTNNDIVATFRDAWIIKGSDNGLDFEPDRNISRAEVLSILIKSLCQTSEEKKHPFVDVIKNHWSNDVIWTAYNIWLLKGLEWNTIKPFEDITQYEVLLYINRLTKAYEDIKGVDIENREEFEKISVDYWFVNSIEELYRHYTREEFILILRDLFGITKIIDDLKTWKYWNF